ncbi:unnamed protein product [Ilex paraguariensis]|uniref:Myosin heavy chain n=2 Tax=Ilex paraguariensis TaxID=185542 RepID=A0ABC8S2L4_9AQUA
MANAKEKELAECLNVKTDEKKTIEDALVNSTGKLAEAENLLEVLRNELNLTQRRLEGIESDLKAAGLKESEVMEKLKYAEEQLERQGGVLEQTTAKHAELESLHETLTRDSELKLQEAIGNFTSRDSEAKSLYEKVKTLEDQLKNYEDQIAEASEKSASVKEELDKIAVKLASSESTNEELNRKILEAEDKAAQYLSEKELLVETNIQLKSKVDELHDLVNSAHAEKEATAHELVSHMNTITELTEKHSRASELHLAAETRVSEAETQLKEAIQKLSHKDSEAKELNEKLNDLEGQTKLYSVQAHEVSTLAETRKIELEQTLSKLKDLESIIEELQSKSGKFEKESEGLAEANLKITQQLASYESKLNDAETKLSAAFAEKDEAVEQVHSSKKTIEDLTLQLASEAQMLQAQISTVMEENNLLNETYKNATKELQTVILQLEGQLKEQKSSEDALKAELEILKAEIGEKSVLQNRLKELEEQLSIAKARVKEEVESVRVAATARETELTSKLEDHVSQVRDRDMLSEQVLQLQRDLHQAQTNMAEQKEADSKKDSERKAALAEIEAKSKAALILEQQVKELEQKLQLAAKSKEKDLGSNLTELRDDIEVKSRDIGSTISTPSKRRSKKKAEVTSAQTSSSTVTNNQITGDSPTMTYKFILVVAIVSVIIGVILGKRY